MSRPIRVERTAVCARFWEWCGYHPRRTAEELHLRQVEIIESTPDVMATIRPTAPWYT